jgi:hypothetical protein
MEFLRNTLSTFSSVVVSSTRNLMSFLSPSPTITENIENIMNLRENVQNRHEELMRQIQVHEKKIHEHLDSGNAAKLYIRLKLIYENEVKKVRQTLTAIESHLLLLQNANLNKEIYTVMKGANVLPKEEDVEDVVDNMAELHEKTNDIMQILTNHDSIETDDDVVENEFKRLQKNTATLKKTTTEPLHFPVAPTNTPAIPLMI